MNEKPPYITGEWYEFETNHPLLKEQVQRGMFIVMLNDCRVVFDVNGTKYYIPDEMIIWLKPMRG